MEPILFVGIILFVGFLSGECARFAHLPKVTGYILAGILLNPRICTFIPQNFSDNTNLITNIALAFICFSVGGTLLYPKIKKLGKTILLITFFEAEFAFLTVAIVFILLGKYLLNIPGESLLAATIPFGLLAASLASPTDPSATLAVVHEYKANGEVSSTVMGVAAFDDILGIINYSIAVVFSTILITHSSLSLKTLVLKPIILILCSLALGILFGFLFNYIIKIISRETEGALIVLIFSFLSLCFGIASLLNLDELLASVAMGVVVVNFCKTHVKIFNMLERYTEELIFVLFFTISGMHLDFSVIASSWTLIALFVIFRSLGKFVGVFTGATLSHASAKAKKYVAGGLIPQGGIVIGLALIIQQNDVFSSFSSILINVIIGATVIHELVGPIIAKFSIFNAGEIKGSI